MTSQAHAKINAFLKITGRRGNYHEIISRFVKLPDLYDTITFKEVPQSSLFKLEGDFNCELQNNTIYKVYELLKEYSDTKKIDDFFKVHSIEVEKNIPSFAGLGGGSSDAATFLNMCNTHINLNLDAETLADIGSRVGADIPFFVYNYNVANVSGIGELVAPFDDEGLCFETFTPNIACDTALVYKQYAQKHYAPLTKQDKQFFATLSTKDALNLNKIHQANDLYLPAKDLYPELANYETDHNFFSGSGSTFFTLKD